MVRELEALNDSQVKREQTVLRRVQRNLAQELAQERRRPGGPRTLLFDPEELDEELLEVINQLKSHQVMTVHGIQSTLRVQERADNAVRLARSLCGPNETLSESDLPCLAAKGARANLKCHRRHQAQMVERMSLLRDNHELLREQIERCRATNTCRDIPRPRVPAVGRRSRDDGQNDHRRATNSVSSQVSSGRGQQGNARGGRESNMGRPRMPGTCGQIEKPGERGGRQH